MSDEFCLIIVLRSQVSVENCLVSGARAQKLAIPSDGADSPLMAGKGLDQFAFLGVPDLQHARICADGQHVASVAPLNTRH
jgi:hypothetical protein